MKDKKYVPVMALAAIMLLAVGTCVVIRALSPMVVLPKLDIPNMVLISLAALLLDHYLVSGIKKWDVLMPVLAALTFGLLPYCGGFVDVITALKLALVGGIVFGICGWLFLEVQDRLSSGPAAKAAPLFSALGLYLAAQCMAGIIL